MGLYLKLRYFKLGTLHFALNSYFMFILYVEDCHCACTWDESALKALLGVKWAPDAIYIILFFQLHFALYFMGFRLNILLLLYVSIYFFFSPDALHLTIFFLLYFALYFMRYSGAKMKRPWTRQNATICNNMSAINFKAYQ